MMQTLYYMGADLKMARLIFLLEGLVICVGGAMVGMLLGALVLGLQQSFGIIKMGSGDDFITEAYPVAMRAVDFGSSRNRVADGLLGCLVYITCNC